MNDTTNTGGPAFPHDPDAQFNERSGMTLRDYFAAKAMAVVWTDIPDDVDRDLALDRLGRYAYEMADAMLKARSTQ